MIKITIGDSLSLQLLAKKDTTPFDLTGAVMETHFLDNQGNEVVVGDTAHHIATNQAGADKGKYTIDLTSLQTASFNIGPGQSIISKAIQGQSIVHFRGVGILTVYSDSLAD